MADEPNKNMDAMLRAYAKKRGAAPELPVHPATRRMLQGEVRRVHGVPAPPRAGWRAHLPQFAFGAALSLVIGLTVAILRFTPKEKQLAKSEIATAEGDVANLTVTAANEPAKDSEGKEQSLLREHRLALAPPIKETEARQEKLLEDTSVDKKADAENTLALADAPPRSVALLKQEADSSGIASDERLKRSSAPKPAAVVAPREMVASATAKSGEQSDAASRTDDRARANELTNLGAALRTRFVQNDQPAATVLRSFQVEQLGEQLRFVDFDGSIYLGAISRNQNPGPPETLPEIVAHDLAANAAVYSFQASGTNRTLGRSIAIEGQYFDQTNWPAQEKESLRLTASEAKQSAPARRSETQQPRRTIIGHTTIGGTNQVPLRAVSVER